MKTIMLFGILFLLMFEYGAAQQPQPRTNPPVQVVPYGNPYYAPRTVFEQRQAYQVIPGPGVDLVYPRPRMYPRPRPFYCAPRPRGVWTIGPIIMGVYY